MEADQVSDASSGKQIRLPEPDADNITVLTKELPNEPILPWHHYDSPWLEGEEKHRVKAEHKAASDKTDAEESSEQKAEALLVELKEKITAELELLEQTEPQAQNPEPNGNVEEIAELARELASKLEAKQAAIIEAPTQPEQGSAEVKLNTTQIGSLEDLIEDRDEVE